MNYRSSISSTTRRCRDSIVTAHDVSARVTAELELQDTMRELRDTFSLLNATLESTADGILVVDIESPHHQHQPPVSAHVAPRRELHRI